ncbi:MAG: hypothetical protein AB1635_17190 [Acidobacteriota bacterium]
MLLPFLLAAAVALAQAPTPPPLPQNPSPMTDTTRPHPRVAAYEPRGQRAALDVGRLFVRDGLKPAGRLPFIVHVHGAPWLAEHHVAGLGEPAVLVSVNLGSGSRVYAAAFAEPAAFARLLEQAAAATARLLGAPVAADPIILTSFSAGYGAVRAILRVPEHYARIDAVLLADSLHAGYLGADTAGPRTQDLPVDGGDLDAFLRFAGDAAAGRKRFLVTHSEVYPGTYASTTETADLLLSHVGLRRRADLREAPLGMQQLSATSRGGFTVRGYAGNSAPDHLDHLYALGAWLAEWGLRPAR